MSRQASYKFFVRLRAMSRKKPSRCKNKQPEFASTTNQLSSTIFSLFSNLIVTRVPVPISVILPSQCRPSIAGRRLQVLPSPMLRPSASLLLGKIVSVLLPASRAWNRDLSHGMCDHESISHKVFGNHILPLQQSYLYSLSFAVS